MKTKFTVGEMAKLYHMSKQALIFYDREKVFCPKYVDPDNGYRYYTGDQLELLDSILMLKEMGLSLKEIREYLNIRDTDVSIEIMEQKYSDIQKQLERLALVKGRLYHKLETLKEIKEQEGKILFLPMAEREYMAVERVEAPNQLLQVDIATKRLLKKASERDFPYYYQLGVMVPVEKLQKGKYVEAEYACLPLQYRIEDDCCEEKKEGSYIRGYHVGDYDTIGITYEKMLERIREEGLEAEGFSYEYCVLDSLTTRNMQEYVTEIQIPVRRPEKR